MRIGFDARMMGTGQRGIGRYSEELLRAMTEAGEHEWWIILRGYAPEWLKGRAHVNTVTEQSRWYTLKEQVRLPKVFASLPVDLIHIPHFNVPLVWLWKKQRPPLVVTIHDCILAHHSTSATTTRFLPLWYTKRWVHRLTMMSILQCAQAVIVPSQSVAKDCEQCYGVERLFDVTPEGVRVALHRCGQVVCTAATEHPYILTVGSAYPHKNLLWIKEVMTELVKRQPSMDIRWVHVGRKDAFWRVLVGKLPENIRPRVTALGEVSDEELAGWYAHASTLLVPSLMEGYGLMVGEALAQATPVICSDIPVFRELYCDRATILSLDDVEPWVNAVETLIEEHPLRAERIANLPTWERAARATMEVYQRAMGMRGEQRIEASW